MLDWRIITFIQVKHFFKKRRTIKGLAIILASFLYCFLIDFYDKSLNPFDYLRLRTEKYNFYSGTVGGMYERIGALLQEQDSIKKNGFNNIFGDIKIINSPTNGGYQNPLSVLTDPTSYAFGLVEDDIYSKDDVVRMQLNYIAPIYLERMHILYRKADLKNDAAISKNTDDAVLKLFSGKKISTGPVGSGTKILASYIINELNNQIENLNKKIKPSESLKLIGEKIVNTRLDQAYDDLKKDSIDILFIIAGAPLKKVDSLLMETTNLGTPKFGLMSIDPSLISELNKDYDLGLRITDFKRVNNKKSIYIHNRDSDKIVTMGTYCYLITNPKTPPSDIREILEKLKSISIDEKKDLPLDEYRFLDAYENSDDKTKQSIIRNFVLFAISVFLLSISIVTILIWGLSRHKHDNYIRELVRITLKIPRNELPEKEFHKLENYNKQGEEEQESEIKEFIVPEIKKNQLLIINLKIVPGIHELLELRNKLAQDFSEGSLTDEHYTFLMNRADEIMSKFRKSLGLRLNEIIERKGKNSSSMLELIRKYCTADYLSWDDFELLKKKIKSENE